LRRFIENIYDKTPNETLKNLTEKIYVVDKLHIQGHTETWCHKNCHPNLFPELEEINTIVCEQINFTLGRYKYILKHMNSEHFSFYTYILFNELNKIKIDGKYDLFDRKKLNARATLLPKSNRANLIDAPKKPSSSSSDSDQ
jgi:hypothetical protein